MKIPTQTKPTLWGLAGGAAALAFIGFSWGGWLTAGTAETRAAQRVQTAVVEALAPICVDKFRHASDATAQLVELKKIGTWSQGDFVEKGGWATVPGTNPPEQVRAVAIACASMLSSA
jgi:alpha/beta superfamily hydrolase